MASLRELHDRLGAMIDQVGQPDYSLREMVSGLREIRDALFVASSTACSADLVAACRGLIHYWTRNLQNFQWEKADTHVKRINAALPVAPEAK
jgi:hypothetical protein